MLPIYSILTDGATSDGMQNLPLIFGAVCAVVLLIAFFIGVAKGFRRVRWGGVAWVLASVAYFLVSSAFVEENPIVTALEGMALDAQTSAFVGSLALALACVVSALLLQGVFSAWLRPRLKRVRRCGDRFYSYENGIQYDDEKSDYDDYEEYCPTEMVVRKGFQKPSLLGRLLGGLFCVINAFTVFVSVAVVALFIVGGTSLKETTFAPLFEQEVMTTLIEYVSVYGFDFLLIGFVMKVARKGYEKGFVASVRALFGTVGTLGASIVSFWLPFSLLSVPVEEGGMEIVYGYVSRCESAVTSMGLPVDFAPIVGRILAGLILFVFALLLVWLIGHILQSLADGIEGVGVLRVVDGALSCFVYLVIGVAICLLLWALWYVLGAYGIFDASVLFADGSLAKNAYDACGVYLQPALDALQETLAGLIPVE